MCRGTYAVLQPTANCLNVVQEKMRTEGTGETRTPEVGFPARSARCGLERGGVQVWHWVRCCAGNCSRATHHVCPNSKRIFAARARRRRGRTASAPASCEAAAGGRQPTAPSSSQTCVGGRTACSAMKLKQPGPGSHTVSPPACPRIAALHAPGRLKLFLHAQCDPAATSGYRENQQPRLSLRQRRKQACRQLGTRSSNITTSNC